MARHFPARLLRAAGLIALCAIALCTGCDSAPAAPPYVGAVAPAAPEPPRQSLPPPSAGPDDLPAITIALPPRPPAAVDAIIPDRAIELIIAFEVGSPEVYTAKYQRPIWPGAASGVTIGIGYDLGHTAPRVIALDWETHPHAVRLASASGTTGVMARELVRELADITIEYGYARRVFDQTSVVNHYRIARRVFGGDAFDALPPNAQGALVSVVFNRGGAMAGERRREMRHIRDVCIPARDTQCIAQQLRAMSRIWTGTPIDAGMRRRRHAEAALAITH
jgi:hypothetical protein